MASSLQPPVINEPPGSSTAGGSSQHSIPSATVGGRFDFDDGGVYVGGWSEGKAHGHGVCTGPKGQGEYSGSWSFGFELSGLYRWPSGATYEGTWMNGKRHGLGVEYRGKWVFRGEWTQGYKGRYGVRSSLLSAAKYEGTWANGLQDGYGSETYADGGTYQGQWLRGTRHGYGLRQSAAFGHCNITKAALSKSSTHASLHSLETEAEGTLVDHKRDAAMRGGFILVVRAGSSRRRNSLLERSQGKTPFFRLRRKQKSTGDLVTQDRSLRSSASVASSTESGVSSHRGDNEAGDAISNASFLSEEGDIHDPSTTEVYMGEWKGDKRCGFGVCERSDGLKYEGEFYNNKKYGYGVTTFRDGSREEGKYKNNVLVTNIKKKHLFLLRSSKTRERIQSAVEAAKRAQEIALQKADIAISRTAAAREKSEQADYAAASARQDSLLAFTTAKQYGGDFQATNTPEAPLRRRPSDFQGSFRRGTKDNILGQGAPASFPSPSQMSASVQPSSSSRQFLDPTVPFGGRRGSFRGNDSQSLLQPPQTSMPPSQPPPSIYLQPQASSSSIASQQLNVPSLSFEPATPSPGPQFPPQRPRPSIALGVNQPPSQLHQTLQMQASNELPSLSQQQQMQESRNQYSFPSSAEFRQQQLQQQMHQQSPFPPNFQNVNHRTDSFPRIQQFQVPQGQLQSQQEYQMNQQLRTQQQHQYQLQQQQQMQQMHQIQDEQQRQQFLREDQRRNQREPSPINVSQFQTHHHRRQSIHQPSVQQQHHHHHHHSHHQQQPTDAFSDHFDHYSALVNRYAQSAKTPAASTGKRRSRTPVVSNISPNTMRSLSPPSRDSLCRPPGGQGLFDKSIPDSLRGSVNLESSYVMNQRVRPPCNLLSDTISYGSMSFAGGEDTPSRGQWRTSSLIRTAEPSGVQGLRRKPSVQTTTLKQSMPAMSREEASALSHAQREHVRYELDYSERLRRNPFLYLVNPRFTAWLNRSKLLIFVILINISIAAVFYHLFG